MSRMTLLHKVEELICNTLDQIKIKELNQ